MTVKVLDFDELPVELHPQLASLRWQDRESPQDRSFVRRLRRAGFPATEYFGVYAVEGGEILARIETLALAYRPGGEPQTALGISDVLTRPDALRRGLARRLLVGLHRREAALGREWSFLWTQRSWGAHRLYEKLGYRDIYSPPVALRKVPSRPGRPLPAGYGWRAARARDLDLLERLLWTETADRLGFVPRPAGAFRLRDQFGWSPVATYRILLRGGRPVGYARLQHDRESVAPLEVVVLQASHALPMVGAIESEALGRWVTYGSTTFVSDHGDLLSGRGYTVYRTAHSTLMARPLRARARSEPDPAVVAADPRYSSHRGDMF